MTDEIIPIAGPSDPLEEEAWALLLARWNDPQAHRAFLARFGDLEALARAGARYRSVLERSPDDAVAAAGRDEVLRKATVIGLAAVPRSVAPEPTTPWVKRGLLAALAILGLGLAVWAALALLRTGAVR